MRGTWYHYNQKTGLTKLRITKQRIETTTTKHNRVTIHDVSSLHKYTKHQIKFTDRQKLNWVFINQQVTTHHNGRKYTWLNLNGWEQGAGDGEYYSVTQIKGRPVLTTASGAGIWVEAHYYRSAKLARHLTATKYPGFVYQP